MKVHDWLYDAVCYIVHVKNCPPFASCIEVISRCLSGGIASASPREREIPAFFVAYHTLVYEICPGHHYLPLVAPSMYSRWLHGNNQVLVHHFTIPCLSYVGQIICCAHPAASGDVWHGGRIQSLGLTMRAKARCRCRRRGGVGS